jgi:hypothetical protein
MPKRALRVIKRTPIALSVCEYCGFDFKSCEPTEDDAEADMTAQFDAHKCKATGERVSV